MSMNKLLLFEQPYINQSVLSTCCPTKLHTTKNIHVSKHIKMKRIKAVRTALHNHTPISLLTRLSSGHKTPIMMLMVGRFFHGRSVFHGRSFFGRSFFGRSFFGRSFISCRSCCFKARQSSQSKNWRNVVHVVVLNLRNLTDQALIFLNC